ncbi:hypothetical protein PoB_004341900 [Plakobranchus ocellatus]|uniref:Transposase n=1 Tax=Plakobranchus ocellatus TaxID=259542 RepID=A0AAV4BDM3_9GAST|nr:hypothetical protein PoB_004341900 [Plakobranchus ocellatus]
MALQGSKQVIFKYYYASAKWCLSLLREKKPGHLTKGVVLQHDNATLHTATMTVDWIDRYEWDVIPHLLPQFGLGKRFITAVPATLSSAVRNNNNHSLAAPQARSHFLLDVRFSQDREPNY